MTRTDQKSDRTCGPIPLTSSACWPVCITTRTRFWARMNTATTRCCGAYRPHAVEVAALVGTERHVFSHIEVGLFAVALPFTNLADYRLEVSYEGGGDSPVVHTVADAYRFLPTLGEVDLHLFAEGRHERLWEVLGAHPRRFTTPDGVVKVSFAVWAPNAKGVSLIGEFNHWDGNEAPLRVLGSLGGLGVVLAGFPGRRAVQVPRAWHRRFGDLPRGPDGLRHRGAAADGVAGDRELLQLERRRVDGAAGRAEPGVRADVHLRGRLWEGNRACEGPAETAMPGLHAPR